MSETPRLQHPDDIALLSEAEREAAIAQQRHDLGCKPWEYSPLEVDDGASPYPSGSAGQASWVNAQRLRRKWRTEASRAR